MSSQGHLKVPRLAADLSAYGEQLFKQVFAHPDAYVAYKQKLQQGPSKLQFEVVGSPEFQGHRISTSLEEMTIGHLVVSAK